jgi:hypothetical protein
VNSNATAGDGDHFVSRFRDPGLSAYYAKLRETSYRHNIFKVFDIDVSDEKNVLTMFNSFRLTRTNATMAVTLETLDYATGEWSLSQGEHTLMRIPLWPVRDIGRGMTDVIVDSLLYKLNKECGYAERAAEEKVHGQMVYDDLADGRDLVHKDRLEIWDKVGKERGLTYRAIWHLFKKRMFGSGVPARKPVKTGNGRIGYESIRNGLKGLRKAFHEHIREKEVFAAALGTNHKAMSIADYACFARNRVGLLKQWRERRNLVPLLPFIEPAYWDRDDLFSRANWVGQDGIVNNADFTLVARHSPYSLPSRAYSGGVFSPFETKSQFRWLSRSSNMIVKKYVEEGMDNDAVALMADLNVDRKLPVLAIRHIMGSVASVRNKIAFVAHADNPAHLADSRIRSVYRAFAIHCADLWRDDGHAGMKARIQGEEGDIGHVFDYLVAVGFRNGIPEPNTTWTALWRRARAWQRPGRVLTLGDDNLAEDAVWDFEIGAMTVEGARVTPLGGVKAMRSESETMHHCVASYSGNCANGGYRAYHIEEKGGSRSTLGFFVADGKVLFDQIKGPGNAAVSAVAKRIANHVVDEYQRAMDARGAAGKEAA